MNTEHVQFGDSAESGLEQALTSSGRRAQTERRLRTEDSIVAAAGDLFLEHGFKSTTIRGIAAKAGVSVGRVMAAGDKDVLLVRCFDGWIAGLQAGEYAAPYTRRTNAGRTTEPGATSAVHDHLLGIFTPFLEFFAAHEDLSRDYAAALMRVPGKPRVFTVLAAELQDKLATMLTSIGLAEDYARASAAVLYDSYLGILFRWAASDVDLGEAVASLSQIIAFHTVFRRPL